MSDELKETTKVKIAESENEIKKESAESENALEEVNAESENAAKEEGVTSENVIKEDTERKTEEAKAAQKAEEKESDGIDFESIDGQKPERKPEKAPIKKKKKSFLVPILIVVFLLVAAVIYVAIAFYYRTHFFKNTTINSVACGNLEATAVVAMLDEKSHEYQLEVYGRNPNGADEEVLLGTILADDIGYSDLDSKKAIEECLSKQNPYFWIEMYIGGQREYELFHGIEFDLEKLSDVVLSWDGCKERNMKAPENAYISEYSEADNRYSIIPETKGTQFDVEKAITYIQTAVSEGESAIHLEELGCYGQATVTADNLKLNATVDTLNKWLSAVITYDWNGTKVVVDRTRLKDWVTYADGKAALDEEAVLGFVKETAKELDTYGRNKKFTTSLDVELTLPSAYGWQVNRQDEAEALIGLIYDGAVTDREPVYSITAWNKGVNDIGSSYVEIDLSNQHLYLYVKGELVLETDFVSGNMSNGNFTPPGVFGLTYKTKEAVLRGTDYATPVHFWMPFNGNVGMHDATWRSNFGGSIYLTSGSHGCINLPLSKAESIYGYISDGFPVICYYYEPVQDIVARLVGQPANIPDETVTADGGDDDGDDDED